MIQLTADFLLDCLSLAAYNNTEHTKLLLGQALEIYRNTKKKYPDTVDPKFEVFFNIISDIVEANANLEKKAEVNRVILKIKRSPICLSDPKFIDQVAELLQNSYDVSQQRIDSLTRRIQQWIFMCKLSTNLQKILFKCNEYKPDTTIDNDLVVDDILTQVRDLEKITEGGFNSSETIDMVDMTDPDSVAKSLTLYKTKRNSNVFPTGLKGLNRMLGKSGGFKRGEFWAFAASSHNYKSGILMDIARWCTQFCEFSVSPGLTPCVVLISLENEVPENTWHLMERAYISAYKEPPKKDMLIDELSVKIAQYYSCKGVKFLMFRQDENFGFTDFLSKMNDIEKKGYCIIACIIDYITLMRIDESSDNPAKRLQKLGQQFANYFKRKDMLGVTGLQLDTAADLLNASGRTNVVREYGAVHLADCKGIRRELTGLIFMHLERNMDEEAFLTLAWDKHRDEPPPAKEDKYTAYHFSGTVVGIREDYNTDHDYSLSDIYSVNIKELESDLKENKDLV